MDWDKYNKLRKGNGKLSYTYKAFRVDGNSIVVGDTVMSREAYEAYVKDNELKFDYGSTRIRYSANKTYGVLEIADYVPYVDVEKLAVQDFIKTYDIADKVGLSSLLENFTEYSVLDTLKSLSELPELLRKFQ